MRIPRGLKQALIQLDLRFFDDNSDPTRAEKRAKSEHFSRFCDDEVLVKKATSLGVVVPADVDVSAVWIGEMCRIRCLTQEQRALISREVLKTRRANFKSWSEIVVPILALVIALAAWMKKPTPIILYPPPSPCSATALPSAARQ